MVRLSFGAILVFCLTLSLGMYFGNPSGTASMDPRARLFGFLIFGTYSVSNAPTIEIGDLVWVSTFAFWSDPVARGDMLVFIPPHDPRSFVKRVVAIGGDRLSISEGVVILNGYALDEPYVAAANNTFASTMPELTVPAGKLFVMGDNRDRSQDSRSYGFVDGSGVIGRVGYVFEDALKQATAEL